MHVYFHIDELARDAVVAAGLKNELQQVGGRLYYGNRLMTAFLLKYVSDAFDAVVLPSLRHYMEVFPDTENLPKNVFILQTEAIGQATGSLRRLNGKYFGDDSQKCEPWHRSVAGFLLWGYAHLNPFRDSYPFYLAKCRVVGHPRLSKVCRKQGNGVPNKKPVIGFVSRFNLLSPHDKRTPFESVISSMRFGQPGLPIYENSPDKDVEDMFYTEIIDFRVMLEVMMSLDTNRYAIHVRPHPRENRQGWMRLAQKLNIKITVSPWDQPFGHWLQGVDMIVTPPSTSLYDIYFQGKVPIVTSNVVRSRADHILTESDDKNQILEGTCRPESVQEIVALIDSGKVPFDKEIVDLRLLEQVAADIADKSIANVLAALVDLGPPIDDRKSEMMRAISRHFYVFASLIVSHLRWIKGKLIGRVEQGSGFDLTIQRIKWIDRLTATR